MELQQNVIMIREMRRRIGHRKKNSQQNKKKRWLFLIQTAPK